MKFGVGVIGATGYIASPYRQEIRESTEQANIVALCARRENLLQAAGEEDGATLLTADWREVVNHPDVDFIIVATPDALHHEAVMACAQQGKHLLCEKPVGMNANEAFEMWAAYRNAGLASFVPYWSRYLPIFKRAREIVQAGTLGEIQSVVYRWHNPRPLAMPFTWRDDASLSSAGSIADVGSHAYDTMRWILDQEATRVLAHADVISPAKPDLGDVNLEEALDWGEAHETQDSPKTKSGTAYDYAAISFEMQNGAVGSLILSHSPFLRKGLSPEVELHGTDASLSLDRTTGDLILVKSGKDPEVLENIPNPGLGNRFAQFVFPALESFINGEETLHPDLQDGWRVQLFTDAAALSAKKGTWVSLSELEPD